MMMMIMMMDFSRCKKKSKKNFCNLPGITNLIISGQDVAVRTYKNVEYATPKLHKNIVMDGDTMIDKKTGEVLDAEFDSTYWKDNF